jgi:hypothetical protein
MLTLCMVDWMLRRPLTLAIFAAGLAVAGAALATEPYQDGFFVKRGATARQMFQDRAECARTALTMGDTAALYSNPEYGALAAMGSALDEDSLHEGGIHKRLQRAVVNDCMKRLGWAVLDPEPDEARTIARASPKHPEALDAWLKTHEPPEPAPVPPPATAAPVASTQVTSPSPH